MAAPRPIRVAVAGPNGTLGPTVITHAVSHGIDVTLLTRNPEKVSHQYPPPIKTVKADYEDVEQLTGVLKDGKFDSLIILINRDILEPQMNLINAAITAMVPHIIPSSFGIGSSDPRVRGSPALKEKLAMEDYLTRKANEGTVTYTILNTGLFLDWGLERGVPVNLKGNNHPTFLADGGDAQISTSTLDLIGDAVARVVLKRDELRNRSVFVQSVVVSQNQLLAYAKEIAPDKEFNTIPVDTAAAEQQALEKLRNGERTPDVMRMLLLRISFGWRLGLFEKIDNELLGLPTMSEEDLRVLVAKCVNEK